jgi:hypothetical protein
MNLYAYVGSDPVNFRDPFGWQEQPDQEVVVVTGTRPDSMQELLRQSAIEAWLRYFDALEASALRAAASGTHQGAGEPTKCTWGTWMSDAFNQGYQAFYNHIPSFSANLSWTVGADGEFERYTATLGVNLAGQFFISTQGPPDGRGSRNLQGIGSGFMVAGAGSLGYSHGPILDGVAIYDVVGGAGAAGPGIAASVASGETGGQSEAPFLGRLSRFNLGGGAIAALFRGREKAFINASRSIIPEPSGFSGCGGRID